MNNESKSNRLSSWIKPIIISLIPIIIGGIVVFNYTQPNVDLKYTLSDNIFISSENTNIQQLEIKNLGTEVAEKIVIDVFGDINKIEVKKNSEKDIYEQMDIDGGTQINYPELPPMSSIFITIDSVGNESVSVSVKHNSGIASAALDSNNTSLSSWILSVVVFGVFIWNIYVSIRNVILNYYTTYILRNNAEKVLSRKNVPFFVKDSEWKEIRVFAFTTLQKEIWRNCRNTYNVQEITKFLSEDELEKLVLTKEEKKDFIDYLSNTLKLWFDYQIDDSWSENNYINLLKVEKPFLLDEEMWLKIRKHILSSFYNKITKNDYISFNDIKNDARYKVLSGGLTYLNAIEQQNFKLKISKNFIQNLKKEISNSYLDLKKISVSNPYLYLSEDLSLFYSLDPNFKTDLISSFIALVQKTINLSSISDLEIFLKTEKPIFLESIDWDELLVIANSSLSNKYKQYLLECIFSPKIACEEIFKISDSDNQFAINLNDSLKLAEKLYAKSALDEILLAKDIDYIKENYQIHHIYNWKFIEEILQAVSNMRIFKDIICTTKEGVDALNIPRSIDRVLVEHAKKYVVEKDQLACEIEKHKEENAKLEQIKDKITKQLKFINDLLQNPTLIDSIEDYEDLFSKVNYQNLKEMFQMTNKQVEGNTLS